MYILAEDESVSWYPLVFDFILVGKKLELLDFIYNHGSVVIIESLED
jgi:hypothetical protein